MVRGLSIRSGLKPGSEAQFSHDLHPIFLAPVLDDLALGDADNKDCGKIDAAAGWRYAIEVAGMRARHGHARYHLVAFGNQVFDVGVIIGHTYERLLMHA